MRLPLEALLRRTAALAALTIALGMPAAAALASAPQPAAASASDVERVLARLRADPDLSGVETTHELRPKKRDDAEKPPSSDWVVEFARWLSRSGRFLMWALGFIVVALLLVSLRRFVRWRGEATAAGYAAPPSHVRDLDIRPESLPADIAAAARALWAAGEARAALSLLYRGALSVLVHRHGVPIRAASTEGECVALATRVLAPERSAYFRELVQCWQELVYAGRTPADERVQALCEGHARHFGNSATGASA